VKFKTSLGGRALPELAEHQVRDREYFQQASRDPAGAAGVGDHTDAGR
jgi:hypothetical protein